MISKNDSQTCLTCNGTMIFDVHTDESICNKCGIVMPACDELLHDMTCNKPAQQTSVESLTCNMMYELSLHTFIGEKNVDANGKKIQNFHMEKMRKLDKLTLANDNKIRNLNKAIREIRRITEILGLKSSVAERATYIYRKAFGLGLIRGRSISGIVAAAVYVACKEMEIPHSIDDVENLLEGISKKNVLQYYKMLLKCMKIKIGLPNPISHISKIAERTGLSGKTERKALEILSKVGTDSLLAGKKPISIAAAALYLASLHTKEHTTQLRIALATDLTTITIRKRCVDIMQILNPKSDESENTDTQAIQEKMQCSDHIQIPVLH